MQEIKNLDTSMMSNSLIFKKENHYEIFKMA
jgi:hypothetical protein